MTDEPSRPAGQLSLLDRFLPLWIFLAMGLGIALGRLVPTIGPALDSVKVAGVSLPIALGLFAMMYPLLARVRYGQLGDCVSTEPREANIGGASFRLQS